MKRSLDDVAFICFLTFFAFYAFATAYTGAVLDFKDWGFHTCYAETLDAAACSNGGYNYYAALGHAPAYALHLAGIPVEFTMALIVAACITLIGWWLYRRSGIIGFALFFVVLPILMVYVFKRTPFLWLNWGLCGNYAWVLAFTLFSWLAFNWQELYAGRRLLGLLLVCLAHNYGWGLAIIFFVGGFTRTFLLWLKQEIDLFLVIGVMVSLVVLSDFSPMASARLITVSLLCLSVVIPLYGPGFKE